MPLTPLAFRTRTQSLALSQFCCIILWEFGLVPAVVMDVWRVGLPCRTCLLIVQAGGVPAGLHAAGVCDLHAEGQKGAWLQGHP